MAHFVPDDYIKATFEMRYDSDGKVFLNAIAGADLVAKTAVMVTADEYGPITVALADNVAYYRVGVPLAAADSGDSVWLQHGGYCAAIVTPSLSVAIGHALSILNGAIADAGADYTGLAGQFAACATASTSAETQDVMLVPRQIIGTT